MARAEKTVLIQRPVRSVFDFVLNGANSRLWRASVLEVKPLGEAPYQAGSKFRERIEGPEGSVEGEYEITTCQQDELIEFQLRAGSVLSIGRYRFRPKGTETEVTLTMDAGEDTGLPMQRWLEKEVVMLGELKAFLEKHA